jgi:ribosomal protein S18 acetylase RimI-like enzyme
MDSAVPEPVLRPLTCADWQQLVDIEREVFGADGYSPYFLRMVPELFGPVSWLAEQGTAAIGAALGAVSLAEPAVGWILSLAVRPGFAGRGLGEALSRRCIASLAAHGVRQVRLTVAPENGVARRLYARLGFVEAALEADFFGAGVDRLLLRLPLD